MAQWREITLFFINTRATHSIPIAAVQEGKLFLIVSRFRIVHLWITAICGLFSTKEAAEMEQFLCIIEDELEIKSLEKFFAWHCFGFCRRKLFQIRAFFKLAVGKFVPFATWHKSGEKNCIAGYLCAGYIKSIELIPQMSLFFVPTFGGFLHVFAYNAIQAALYCAFTFQRYNQNLSWIHSLLSVT